MLRILEFIAFRELPSTSFSSVPSLLVAAFLLSTVACWHQKDSAIEDIDTFMQGWILGNFEQAAECYDPEFISDRGKQIELLSEAVSRVGKPMGYVVRGQRNISATSDSSQSFLEIEVVAKHEHGFSLHFFKFIQSKKDVGKCEIVDHSVRLSKAE